MDILPIRKLYISPLLIKVSRDSNMPKPKGTTGSTKMKIMALICYNNECSQESYGYNIWQDLKEYFYIYMNNNDIRNVYHHLNDLGHLGLIERGEKDDLRSKCIYKMTQKGFDLKHRYKIYMDLLYNQKDSPEY